MLEDSIQVKSTDQGEHWTKNDEYGSNILSSTSDVGSNDLEVLNNPEDDSHISTTYRNPISHDKDASTTQTPSSIHKLDDEVPVCDVSDNTFERGPASEYGSHADDTNVAIPTYSNLEESDHKESSGNLELSQSQLAHSSASTSVHSSKNAECPPDSNTNTECKHDDPQNSDTLQEQHDQDYNADMDSDNLVVEDKLDSEDGTFEGSNTLEETRTENDHTLLTEEIGNDSTFTSDKGGNVFEVREQRFKMLEKKGYWTPMSGLVNKVNDYTDLSSSDLTWGPVYEIPSKPGRKGPALGIFSDSPKPNDQNCVVLQTPDSLERYSLSGKLLQHRSCSPYAITRVSCGNVVGMGRVVICGTQCGKVIFYSFFRFEQLLILDTTKIYEDCTRENSARDDPEKQYDLGNALNSTLFEINCLALVNCLENYSKWLAIGNQLGHLLIYEIPSLKLLNFIYHPPDENYASRSSSESSFYDHDDEEPTLSYDELRSRVTKSKNEKNVYISCIRLCSVYNDLWVGYGDGSFAIFEMITGLCKKFVPNASNVHDSRRETITSIHFSYIHNITLIVYGNDKVDVWDYSTLTFIKTFPSSILTCGTSPISSLCIYEMYEKTLNNVCLLFIGSMDGSLILRRVDRLPNRDIAWTLLFNFSCMSSEFDEKKNGNKTSSGNGAKFASIDFREAPITCLYPLLSHNVVLVGNACGGLISACNLFRKA